MDHRNDIKMFITQVNHELQAFESSRGHSFSCGGNPELLGVTDSPY